MGQTTQVDCGGQSATSDLEDVRVVIKGAVLHEMRQESQRGEGGEGQADRGLSPVSKEKQRYSLRSLWRERQTGSKVSCAEIDKRLKDRDHVHMFPAVCLALGLAVSSRKIFGLENDLLPRDKGPQQPQG